MEYKMNDVSKGLLAFVGFFIIIFAIFSPLAVIWSVNTLFGLTIAYGFWEWLAALVLLSCLSARNISSFKQK
jgi:hypothetical protein